MTIVTYAHRPKRSTQKPKRLTHPAPADDDRKPAPAIVATGDRKRTKLRAKLRAQGTGDAAEVSPEVKAFFARMMRPGGALTPKRR